MLPPGNNLIREKSKNLKFSYVLRNVQILKIEECCIYKNIAQAKKRASTTAALKIATISKFLPSYS